MVYLQLSVRLSRLGRINRNLRQIEGNRTEDRVGCLSSITEVLGSNLQVDAMLLFDWDKTQRFPKEG